jgi:hypothetical protein
MPATGRRFTSRGSARVFVVSWRCREVELSGWAPFGVAVAVFRVIQPPGLTSGWSHPQARVSLLMSVQRVLAHSSTWWTSQ